MITIRNDRWKNSFVRSEIGVGFEKCVKCFDICRINLLFYFIRVIRTKFYRVAPWRDPSDKDVSLYQLYRIFLIN